MTHVLAVSHGVCMRSTIAWITMPLVASLASCSHEQDQCKILLTGNYDQSCEADEDCILVSEIRSCPPTPCWVCDYGTINWNAQMSFEGDPSYEVALSQSVARNAPICHCGTDAGSAVCRNGMCTMINDFSSDTLPSCLGAGGSCYPYGCRTGSEAGPPYACAFPNEYCCFP